MPVQPLSRVQTETPEVSSGSPAGTPADDSTVSAVELSIVMPCLNEAETLATCIRKAQGYLECSGVAGEIVIGDNGLTDGSREIATGLGARVIDVSNRGYGAALFGAFAAAQGRYCIMGDSDDSYDFENAGRL